MLIELNEFLSYTLEGIELKIFLEDSEATFSNTKD